MLTSNGSRNGFLKEIRSSQIVFGAIAIYNKNSRKSILIRFYLFLSLTAAADRPRVAISPPFEAFRRFSLPRRESEDEIAKGKRLLRL